MTVNVALNQMSDRQRGLRVEFLSRFLDALQVCKVHNEKIGIFSGSVFEFDKDCLAFGLITGGDPDLGVLGEQDLQDR